MYLSKNVIDLENGNYTFSDYFKMNISSKNLAKVFGYDFTIDTVNFKKAKLDENLNHFIQEFNENLNKIKKRVNLNSEMAKREFLISPIIYQLIKMMNNISVDIETNTYFNKTLKGTIDYVINNDNNIFIAIEAKNADIERGVLQLISELIAIDNIVEEESEFIYGAVTIGFTWCFVILDRKQKIITQHIDYIYIKELESIFKILIGILTS